MGKIYISEFCFDFCLVSGCGFLGEKSFGVEVLVFSDIFLCDGYGFRFVSSYFRVGKGF